MSDAGSDAQFQYSRTLPDFRRDRAASRSPSSKGCSPPFGILPLCSPSSRTLRPQRLPLAVGPFVARSPTGTESNGRRAKDEGETEMPLPRSAKYRLSTFKMAPCRSRIPFRPEREQLRGSSPRSLARSRRATLLLPSRALPPARFPPRNYRLQRLRERKPPGRSSLRPTLPRAPFVPPTNRAPYAREPKGPASPALFLPRETLIAA